VLRYAIETVRWQSYRNFELLVVGDGCTDDSAEVVGSFQDRRIRWRNLPANSGNQSAPNNAGLALARGELVAYLGHDDVWHPTHLEGLVATMLRTGADVVYSQGVMIGPPGSHLRVLTGVSASGEYEPGQGIPPSSLMHRRRMVADIGGWRDYRTIQLPPDVEFVLRAHQAGKRFAASPALTVFKFNSALRPNSYVERPCHEQAEYVRRIRAEPDFLEREWRAIRETAGLAAPFGPPGMPSLPDPLPPGWTVTQWRRIRGLEP
jgi:glycosyltransferase involved in cell wall biosynthesis